MVISKWLWVAAALMFCGCVSQVVSLHEYKQNWIGHPINELKEAVARPSVYDEYKRAIGWTETIYKLDNGNWVYVELDKKDCFIHWEVDPEGIIVGAHTEGKDCEGKGK